jgi:hypothetical protein
MSARAGGRSETERYKRQCVGRVFLQPDFGSEAISILEAISVTMEKRSVDNNTRA